MFVDAWFIIVFNIHNEHVFRECTSQNVNTTTTREIYSIKLFSSNARKDSC